MRFGLGPKPGGPARIGTGRDSALNACLRELENPSAVLLSDSRLLPYEQLCLLSVTGTRQQIVPIHNLERSIRYAKHLEPDVGFVERLVLFWTNHFNMHGREQDAITATIAHMERGVIRPNVLGRFSDLLFRAVTHPAMLRYLENISSVGPRSERGRSHPGEGINENLAREVLELHTLGVNGGYTQNDVIQLAYILTGWSVVWARGDAATRGQTVFAPDRHEPGSFTLLGQTFSQPGREKLVAALDMLANHPRTAEHISFKLLQHFVTDTPSIADVRTLARVFHRTRGDLKAVYTALLRLPQAWSAPMNRIRPPHLWAVAMARAVGLGAADTGPVNAVAFPNQPWQWLTPDGYPDENYYWENADAMRRRLGEAYNFLEHFDVVKNAVRPVNPTDLARDLFPGALSAATESAIRDALVIPGKPHSRFAMLFLSPEFMRR